MDNLGDIKNQITTAVDKITKDDKMQEKFKKDPVKTVEEVLGVDLPDGTIDKVVEAVKTKVNMDKLGGIFGKLGK